MKDKHFVLALFALVLWCSCNSKQPENDKNSDYISSEISLSAPAPSVDQVRFPPPTANADEVISEPEEVQQTVINKKKIIKDGNMSVKTGDINLSKKQIDQLLKSLNAYYESEDLQNNDQSISYDLKIRVPSNNFEKLISGIESGEDEITNKSIQARDVTEEYYDIETRLINKRTYLERYKVLLSKAATVKDILAIEENIRTLEEEIESREGRLKYLKDQIAFSTLNLNLYKQKDFVYKAPPQDKFSERVKTSISNGWASLVDFILWTIKIWPYIILITLLVFIIKKLIRKRRNKKQMNKNVES